MKVIFCRYVGFNGVGQYFAKWAELPVEPFVGLGVILVDPCEDVQSIESIRVTDDDSVVCTFSSFVRSSDDFVLCGLHRAKEIMELHTQGWTPVGNTPYCEMTTSGFLEKKSSWEGCSTPSGDSGSK